MDKNENKASVKIEGKSNKSISLIGLFVLALILFIIGIWLRIFAIFGNVLLVIIFIIFLWRLFIQHPQGFRNGERVSLLGLILVGILFVVLGYWIGLLYTIGIIILVIAFIIFVWRFMWRLAE